MLLVGSGGLIRVMRRTPLVRIIVSIIALLLLLQLLKGHVQQRFSLVRHGMMMLASSTSTSGRSSTIDLQLSTI